MTHAVVVGAGLSGLACAHALRRAGRDVLVLEASERPGGVSRTIEEAGFSFELGPNTVPSSSRAFLELADELGLGERTIAADEASRRRLLWFRGRLVALPSGPLGFLTTPLLSARGKLSILTEPFRAWRAPADDDLEPSLDAFLADRLGREAMRTLAGAFVRGVHGGEIDRLGARSAFPRLWELACQHGGLARGAWHLRSANQGKPASRFSRGTLVSFPRGFQEMIDALAAELGDSLLVKESAVELERRDSGWRVRTESGDLVHAEQLVLAVGAPTAARLLRHHDAAAGELLERVELASITLVQLGFDAGTVELPQAFGFLVPPDQTKRDDAPRALGILFPSRIFDGRAPEGASSVSCIYRAEHIESSDPVATALEDLRRALALDRAPEPVVRRVLEWGPILPQYTVGHADRMGELAGILSARLPGLHLAGNYLTGVSVEHVIQRGRTVAQRILSSMEASA